MISADIYKFATTEFLTDTKYIKTKMNIALNLYGPCSKREMKDEDLMIAVSALNIEYVEPCVLMGGFTHDNPAFWTMSKFQRLYDMMKSIGVGVKSIHVVTESLQNSVDEMFMLSNEYGIKQFVVGMPTPLNENTLREKALVLFGVADKLKSCGARILIHNNKQDTSVKIDGMTAYEKLVEMCDGKVGFQLDLGWCAAGGVDPIDFFKRNESRVESLHFKDFEKPGVSESDVAIGYGSIDTASAIKLAKKNGIPMLIDQDNYSDIRVDLKKSLDYIQGIDK